MVIELGDFSILIDDNSLPFFKSRKWTLQNVKGKQYLISSIYIDGKKCNLYFHRAIINCPLGMRVDHISGDTRDNRLSNLRIVTAKENSRNRIKKEKTVSSRYKGVGFNCGKWRARIRVDYKQIELGRFDSESHAAYAYDMASIKYHGEFGNRNFLPLV